MTMTGEEATSRISMVWPVALKEQVRQRKGTLTQFVIAAVEAHLDLAPTLDEVSQDLDQARYLVQVLADRLVMGGDATDRLSALMEVEFPSWVNTTGWPQAYAERVRSDEEVDARLDLSLEEPEPELEPELEREPEPPTEPVPELDPVQPMGTDDRDDLFATVMRKTGHAEALAGLGVKPASQIPRPAPVVQDDRCTNIRDGQPCNDVLIEDECWTCG